MISTSVPSSNLLDFAQPCKLILPVQETVAIILVGCGGTGSWLAPAVVRIARLLRERFAKTVHIHFVDPDTVEEKNVYRQNFCQAEVGRFKADALAFRYGTAWGMDITAWCVPFKEFSVTHIGGLPFVAACVDNPTARHEIDKSTRLRSAWWLDCGNFQSAGQVLLGSGARRPDDPFQLPGFCSWLPLPSTQHPELLEPIPVGADGIRPAATDNLSCADLALLDSQSLSINQRIAAEAADFLVRALLTHDLTRFAAYLNLPSGSMRSIPITPENIQ